MESLEITEARLQQNCLMYFNNTYCLKKHNPKFVMFSIPNEVAMIIRGALLNEGINESIVNRVIRMVSSRMNSTGLLSGVSDTIVCLPNKVLFIEFKTSTGTQSKSQKEFESKIDALGLPYYICRSLEGFKEIIKKNRL